MPRSRPKHHPALRKVGARIRAIREKQKLSQEAVAHDAGLERAYYSGVERGIHNISLNAIGRIADVLQVPLRDFFEF